jgi:plastocyanin
MGKGTIIAAVVLLVIIAGGAFALTSGSNDKKDSSNTTSTSSTTSDSNTNNSDTTNAAATISYDGSTFSPATTIVKSGDKVTVKNTSNGALAFDSDPHPVHTDDTDLNAGEIQPGGSTTFTVTKKGTFGFHNHDDPTQKGQITIN